MKIKEMIDLIKVKNTDISFYLTFKKARKLIVSIIRNFDNVSIEGCTIEPYEWDWYNGCYLVDFSPVDGKLYVQKGEAPDGKIIKTGFAFVVVQKKVLGDKSLSDFTIDDSGEVIAV